MALILVSIEREQSPFTNEVSRVHLAKKSRLGRISRTACGVGNVKGHAFPFIEEVVEHGNMCPICKKELTKLNR